MADEPSKRNPLITIAFIVAAVLVADVIAGYLIFKFAIPMMYKTEQTPKKAAEEIGSVKQSGSASNGASHGRFEEIDLGGEGKLDPDEGTGNQGCGQEGHIEKDGGCGFFEMMGWNGKQEGKDH